MTATGTSRTDPAERAVVLAGLVLLLVGVLSMIEGIAALAGSSALADAPELIVGSPDSWGTALVVLGGAAGLLAVSLWSGAGVRWIVVALAATNGVVQLLFLPVYPLWSLAVFALNVLVIAALVAPLTGDRS